MSINNVVWESGLTYHITTRGNRRNDIFRDEEDFQIYLSMLENNLVYYSSLNYRLVSYCLMDNHVHLVIQTDKEPLKRFMARLNSMYTKYFNKKYNYIGHLFQARYFAEPIEDDIQLLEVSRYVHLNPVKARMVEWPDEYKWSSYSMLIGEKYAKLIDEDIILNYFQYERRFELYKEFVEKKLKLLREALKLQDEENQGNISEVGKYEA